MWPFNRTQTPKVKLTNLAYGRWLRANKPPMDWFLAMTEDEQEQLAIIGDEFTQDMCIAMGYACKDPQAAEAGIDAMSGEQSGEDSLLRMISEKAMQAAQAMQAEQPKKAPAEPVVARPKSFGEFGATREELAAQIRGPVKTPRVFGVEMTK
jgi:hypothetical protein